MEEKELLNQVLVTREYIDEQLSNKPMQCSSCGGHCPDSGQFKVVPADLIFETCLCKFKDILENNELREEYFDVIPTLQIAKARDTVTVRAMMKELLFESNSDIVVSDLLTIYNHFLSM